MILKMAVLLLLAFLIGKMMINHDKTKIKNDKPWDLPIFRQTHILDVSCDFFCGNPTERFWCLYHLGLSENRTPKSGGLYNMLINKMKTLGHTSFSETHKYQVGFIYIYIMKIMCVYICIDLKSPCLMVK